MTYDSAQCLCTFEGFIHLQLAVIFEELSSEILWTALSEQFE